MRRTELMHNTREQVSEYLATAAAIVGELELDGDLKVKAFELAVNLVASKQITFEQVVPGGVDLRSIPRG